MKKKIVFGIIAVVVLFLILLYWIPAPQQDFFDHYPYQDEAAAQLKEFRNRPLRTIQVDGIEWHYYIGGNGPRTILFIHGMGGAYDLWWRQVLAFENQFRIITYTLPEEVRTLREAANGILAILTKEQIRQVIIVGTSMGGYIAQYLVDQYPQKIERAVFGNTFPPNNLIRIKNRRTAQLVRFLPEILIFKAGNKQLKEKILPAAHNSPLLAAFLPSLPFSKKQFINRYRVVVDPQFPRPFRYEVKRIPKLIIESDNDPLIDPELRQALKEMYPDARVFTFHNEGHFPYINAAQTYNQVLVEFFYQKNPWEDIEATIHRYFEGRQKRDLSLLKQAFSSNAQLYTSRKGKLVSIPFQTYLQIVQKSQTAPTKTTILDGSVVKDMAMFTVRFEYPTGSYQDVLTLLNTNGKWQIVSKAFQPLP